VQDQAISSSTPGFVYRQLVLPLALVLLSLASAAATRVEARIVCLGDSITRAGYPEELAKIVKVPVVNAGVGGNTSRQGLARLEKDVLTNQPTLVLVFFGANDSRLDAPGTQVPLAEYESNLRTIVDRCQKAGAKVILATPPPIDAEAYYTRHPREKYEAEGGLGRWLEKYCAVVNRVAKEKKTGFLDLHSKLAKEPGWRKPDGVHPTEEGNRIIARLFAETIEAQSLIPPENE
jgi:lysophospholipase L1-like esterase